MLNSKQNDHTLRRISPHIMKNFSKRQIKLYTKFIFITNKIHSNKYKINTTCNYFINRKLDNHNIQIIIFSNSFIKLLSFSKHLSSQFKIVSLKYQSNQYSLQQF